MKDPALSLPKGKVFLVGGGPGDPGLITVKGLECLKAADVVIYDRLIDPQLLSHAKAEAELIYVGKAARGHVMRQEEINALLVEKAQENKVVVRLKGGDPFVFGRGGEEAEVLAAAGIPFEVVPGVTSAVAAAAYAGIPVTQRGYTSSFAVITGHEDPTKEDSQLAWDKLATGVGTLVFLMGVENLPQIVDELMKHGRSPQTPIALIRWGTWPQQETMEGTLEDIVGKIEGQDFGPPAVIVVGEVVRLREKLRWYDQRPLFGKRVLVTRSRDQASRLSALLAEQGAQPIELPTIQIAEPLDYSGLDMALSRLGDYHWIVFTSANGVAAFFRRLFALGQDTRSLGGVKLCAIGPATADALKDYGLKADFIPQEFLTQGIVTGLKEQGIKGARILLPRTDIVLRPRLDGGQDSAGDELARDLEELGAQVEQVIAYRTLPTPDMDDEVRELLQEGGVDIVTFTSSSTVKNLLALLKGDMSLLEKAVIACIGPVTAQAAQDAGLRVDIVAQEHTIPGLVRAIVEHRMTEKFAQGEYVEP